MTALTIVMKYGNLNRMNDVTTRPMWPGSDPEPAAHGLGVDEVHLWWMDLATPAHQLNELARWLDASERERAARFHFSLHRRRYIAAHGQMRALLGAYVGAAPDSLRFEHEERGKPRLAAAGDGKPPPCDIAFNLSHSDDQGLLAIGRRAVLGADIEVQRHLHDLDAIVRSHFTASELCELYGLPESRRHDGFFAAWTRKEAYVKALGAGLSVPLDGFEVALHPDQPAALRSIDGSEEKARAWTLWAGRPTPNSWAAVAICAPGARVRTISLRQLGLP
jgi:4'-phosphopantetheinyl transferase